MKTLFLSFSKIIGTILLLVSILAPGISNAQQIMVTEQGDTLVTITPTHVRTINIVFSDHKLLTEKSNLQSERINLMNKRIELADSTIVNYGILTEELKHEMKMRELAYRNSIKKEKTKYFIIGGVTGVVVGTLVTFLLCK